MELIIPADGLHGFLDLRQEEIRTDHREKFAVPDRRFFETVWEDSILKTPSVRKILYIHKFYYKVTLGMDFSKIMYTYDDGKVLFNGVRFEKLFTFRTAQQASALARAGDCFYVSIGWRFTTLWKLACKDGASGSSGDDVSGAIYKIPFKVTGGKQMIINTNYLLIYLKLLNQQW